MSKKAGIIGGLILITLGLLFLARELYPEFIQFLAWPVIVISLGVAFLVWALLSGTGGLAVPGSILSGIGGILYYQNLTGRWDSWAYIWALIPGLVGIGVILSGIIDRNIREAFSGGLTLILISAILFFAFGSAFGLQPHITQYWPVLLILLGVVALIRAIFPGKRRKH